MNLIVVNFLNLTLIGIFISRYTLMIVTMLSFRMLVILILATIQGLQGLPSIWMHNDLLERHFSGNPIRQSFNNPTKHHLQHHQGDHVESHK